MRILGVTASGIVGFDPDYELIQTILVQSVSTQYIFSSIPQNYKHLQLRFTSKSSVTSVSDTLLRLNGDGGSKYRWHELQGVGSSFSSYGNPLNDVMRVATQPKSGSVNMYAAGVVDILDYSNNTKNTVIKTLAGNHSPDDLRIHLYSGLYLDTAPVTSLNILGSSAIGSRFSLYGIRG